MTEKLETARKAFKECNGDRWKFLDIMCTKHHMTEVGASVYLNELRKEAACEALRERMPWYTAPVPLWMALVGMGAAAAIPFAPFVGFGILIAVAIHSRIK